MPRLVAILILLLLKGPTSHPYAVPDSLRTAFSDRPLLAIEGVWAWTDGATIMIEADATHRLTITLLESPDPAIETPLVIGHGSPAAKTGQYTLSLTDKIITGGHKISPRQSRFIATIDTSRRLILKSASKGFSLRLNIWQALPYLGRISISNHSPDDPVYGAWRLFPPTPDELNPIVL